MNDAVELIEAIVNAYNMPDDDAVVNRAHRLFLSHTFILPIKKASSKTSEPTALFYTENNFHFLPAFSSNQLFLDWAKDSVDQMDWLNITGKDLILGTGENTYLCLDIGKDHYKEFDPKEIIKLKQVILKLEKIAKSASRS